MAKDDGAAAAAPAPAPKKKKMLVVIIAAVLIIAIAAGAAMVLSGGKKKRGRESGEEAARSVVVPFEEKFTVNLRSEDGSNHFLQVPKIELEVYDASVAQKIEDSKSKVSDRISSTLRGKTMREMLEPGSDIRLKEELRMVINDTIKVRDRNKGVLEVILPASYIVQ